jgi:hypothetical protein
MNPQHHSAVVTVVTRNYLHYARALAASIRDLHAHLPIFVCVVDRPEVQLDDSELGIEYVFADTLGIPNWRRFAFQYTAFELSCALKPFVLEHLAKRGIEKLIYLDADIQVYHRLDPIFEQLERHDILLTPHLATPLPLDRFLELTRDIRWKGTYNAGFVAVKKAAATSDFLSWWRRVNTEMCVCEPHRGVFVDQCWLDLVPGMFDSVGIIRDSGWNVAYWNLPVRCLTRDPDGRVLANGNPLLFFHFTGFELEEPSALSRHAPSIRIAENTVLAELVAQYQRRFSVTKRQECESWGYGYALLDDGTPIPLKWRQLVRQGGLPNEIDDPFDASAYIEIANLFGLREENDDDLSYWRASARVLSRNIAYLLPPIVKDACRWLVHRGTSSQAAISMSKTQTSRPQ